MIGEELRPEIITPEIAELRLFIERNYAISEVLTRAAQKLKDRKNYSVDRLISEASRGLLGTNEGYLSLKDAAYLVAGMLDHKLVTRAQIQQHHHLLRVVPENWDKLMTETVPQVLSRVERDQMALVLQSAFLERWTVGEIADLNVYYLIKKSDLSDQLWETNNAFNRYRINGSLRDQLEAKLQTIVDPNQRATLLFKHLFSLFDFTPAEMVRITMGEIADHSFAYRSSLFNMSDALVRKSGSVIANPSRVFTEALMPVIPQYLDHESQIRRDIVGGVLVGAATVSTCIPWWGSGKAIKRFV